MVLQSSLGSHLVYYSVQTLCFGYRHGWALICRDCADCLDVLLVSHTALGKLKGVTVLQT